MSEVFSPQEWQLLSEYIDGQLSKHDRQIVEERLRTSILWKQNYQAIVETKALLQYAPKRKAPRSFLLTQAQAEKIRKPRTSLFSFRFASVLSTGMAVIVFLFGLLTRPNPISTPAMMAAPMQEKAFQTEEVNSTPAGPIIIWGPPGTVPGDYGKTFYGSGGGGGYGGGGATLGMGGGGGDGNIQSFSVAAPTPSSETPADAAPALTSESVAEPSTEGIPEEGMSPTPARTPESAAGETFGLVPEPATGLSSEATPEMAPEQAPAPATDTAVPTDIAPLPETVRAVPTATTQEILPAAPENVPLPTTAPVSTQIPAPADNQSQDQITEAPVGGSPILGVQPAEAGQIVESIPPAQEQALPEPDRSAYWLVSGALLVVGIISGLAAFLTSRKKKA